MNGTRLARNLAAGVVAGIAAWSSYSHMTHVALHFGERPEVAYLLPLSVDGLMVVASVAMVDDKRSGRAVRWSARVAFAAGITASVAANIAAALPSLGARIVAGWPALALLLVVELLSRSGRKVKEPQAVSAKPIPVAVPAAVPSGLVAPTPSPVDTVPTHPTPVPAPASAPSPVDSPAARPAPVVPTPAIVATRITQPHPTNTPATPAVVAAAGTRPTRTRAGKPTPTAVKQAPATTDTPVTESHAAQLTLPVAPDLLTRAAQVATEYRTSHGTPITAGQLAVRLKVTSEQAAQALAVLDLQPDTPTTPTQTVNGRPVKEPR